MDKKTIMIIGAAEEHCIGIKTAQEMGLSVFSTDGNPDSPGARIADHFAIASTYDAEETLSAAKAFIKNIGRISGIMTLAADVPYTVAYVADCLGLPGLDPVSAMNAADKLLMKKCFLAQNIPAPLFYEVRSKGQLADALKQINLPIVIKPVDSRGARGVQLIRDLDELSDAFATAKKYSPSDRVMAEQYLSGPQLSTEGFILNGKAYIPAIFDRNYEYLEKFAPFIVENGGEMPSIYSQQYNYEIHQVMESAAKAMGINHGVIKGDLVIHNGRIHVIEIAARLSGGFFGTVATPVSCGVDLVKANIKLCLGEDVSPHELKHKFNKASAIRFAFPNPGKILQISGINAVKRDSACKFAHVFINENEILPDISNHPERPAVVVSEGSTLDSAVEHANRLINALNWHINP